MWFLTFSILFDINFIPQKTYITIHDFSPLHAYPFPQGKIALRLRVIKNREIKMSILKQSKKTYAKIAAGLGLAAWFAIYANPLMLDNDAAVKAVKDKHYDYTQVKATGQVFGTCLRSGSLWGKRFEATTSTGSKVTGTVCKDVFKSYDIKAESYGIKVP